MTPPLIIFDRVIAIARSPWFRIALAALFIAALWLRGSHYEADRDRWRKAFKAQELATIAVAKEAEAKAIAARLNTETRYARLARTADASALAADQLAAARRYADTHRLRPEAARPARSGPAAASQGDPAKGGDEPGDATEFLAIARNDFDLLVANSIRLQQVHEWGQSLIKDDLALPEPDFGGKTDRP